MVDNEFEPKVELRMTVQTVTSLKNYATSTQNGLMKKCPLVNHGQKQGQYSDTEVSN